MVTMSVLMIPNSIVLHQRKIVTIVAIEYIFDSIIRYDDGIDITVSMWQHLRY